MGASVPEAGSHPAGQAELHRLDASRFDPARIRVASRKARFREVDALVSEHLAVHRSLEGVGFVVTHRPSGCAVAYAEDQEVGLSVAEMLERDHADALEALADAKFGKPAKKSGAHLRARKALEPALKRWR
jgi:hypothetical protein